MSKVNLASREETSTGPIRLPRDSYELRIKEEPTFRMSSKGNPMLTVKLELVSPERKKIDGEERKIAGLEFSDICMLPPSNTFKLEQLHRAAKLPVEFDLDESTGLPVGITYTGLKVWAICKSEESTQMKEDGTPMVNPVSGEVMKANKRSVESYCF